MLISPLKAAEFLGLPPSLAFRLRRYRQEGSGQTETDAVAAARQAVLSALADPARAGAPLVDGPVLIDATWKNAGFWVRAGLLRQALGTMACQETALLGPFSSQDQAKTLRSLGVHRQAQHADLMGPLRPRLRQARALLRSCATPEDVLHLALPENVSPDIFYGGVLKRLQRGVVDLADPELPEMLAEMLGYIDVARRLHDRVQPKLLIASHVINWLCGALADVCLHRGTETILAFANYGVARHVRMKRPDDRLLWADLPVRAELEAIPPARAAMIAGQGLNHLEARMRGATNDIGGRYAFGAKSGAGGRPQIAAAFGWDVAKPMVAVYAPNWFDYPHAVGRLDFRDYADWLQVTLETVRGLTGVNWLLRAHPCDAWYGGQTLTDLLPPDLPAHVQVCPKDTSSQEIQEAVDGIVTVVGTVGLEAAAFGKPVLMAAEGWYGAGEIGVFCRTRDEYRAQLGAHWWREQIPGARERARLLAGLYFCAPTWQRGFVALDDSERDQNWIWAAKAFETATDAINRERRLLRDWWEGGSMSYHLFKMDRAENIAPSNIIDDAAPADVAQTS